MINNYKKGDLIVLIYISGKEKFCSTGVVLNMSGTALTLGHNFKHTSPIDVTKVPIKDILESKKVVPKEINSSRDLRV